MTIFLDFDRTLFDTDAMYRELERRVLSVRFLKNLFNLTLSEFLYPDTVDFLKKNKNHTLILITYGNKKIQRAKVKRCSITDYFSEVIYTDELKGEPIKRILKEKKYTKPIVFVDDTPYQLDSVSSLCPSVEVVRIKRSGQPNSTEERCNDCHEVTNMKELSTLLKK